MGYAFFIFLFYLLKLLFLSFRIVVLLYFLLGDMVGNVPKAAQSGGVMSLTAHNMPGDFSFSRVVQHIVFFAARTV